MHEHGTGGDLTGALLGVALLVFAIGYAWAVAAARGRGRDWPWWRSACAVLGVVLAAVAVLPLRRIGGHDFVWHMWGHLLLGMAAPLALAVASPVRLLLRALPADVARLLSRLLRSWWARAVTHPVVAAVLNVGGLWLLYATSLYPAMHRHAWVDLLVHTHVLLAGWVFAVAILATEPLAHPSSHRLRAAVLVVFMALHGLLTKYVYAHPPQGVPRDRAEYGAQLMYYGGDWIDLVLITLFCWDWYRRTRPERARGRGTAAAPGPARG